MSEIEHTKYDLWFTKECLPIMNDRVAVASKHLDRYSQGAGADESSDSSYFAYFTMHSCMYSAWEIGCELITSVDAPIPLRRSALLIVVVNAPICVSIHHRITPEIIADILTRDDDDPFSWVELVQLVESLLLQQNRKFFDLSRVNFSEILYVLCKKVRLNMPNIVSREDMFACVENIRNELKHQLEKVPNFDSDID